MASRESLEDVNYGGEDLTFPKRKGASKMGGQFYEIYLCMLFLLKKEDDSISNIYLASNMDKGGDLDDVVLGVDYESSCDNRRRKIYFIQTKHRDNVDKAPKINKSTLLNSEKGDFSLKKYFKSYRKIKKYYEEDMSRDDPIFQGEFEDCEFLLYTNALPHETFDKNEDCVQKILIEKESILDSNEDRYYYKLVPNEDVNNALRDACDCKQLAKVLIKYFNNNEVTMCGIIKKYHSVLLEKVFVKCSKNEIKFSGNFFENDEDEVFKRILREELDKANIPVNNFTNKMIKFNNFKAETKEYLPLPADDVKDEEIVEYLNKMHYFLKQPGREELKKIIKTELKKKYKLGENRVNTVFDSVEIKVRDWWENDVNYLTKSNNFFKDSAKFSIWYNVKTPVKSFTGRNEELWQLHDKLQQNSSKLTVISQMASISGLGGIGKTELARRYAQEYSKDYYDDNVIWINADTEESLTESFTNLAKDKLQISVKDFDGNAKNIKSIVGEIYEFFSKGKCLFIFDNVDTKDVIYKHLPLYHLKMNDEKPFVLITSRNQEWDRDMEVLSLNELEVQEAEDFLKKSLNISTQHREIQELINKLQQFPLALQQAVAYINLQIEQDENYTLKKYLQQYEMHTQLLLDSNEFQGIDNQYTKTTFTTWQISIEKIYKNHGELGKYSINILNAIAYCAPNNISKEIFLSVTDNDPDKLTGAIQILVNYSLIKIENNNLTVHRLVQSVTRLRNRENEVVPLKTLLNSLNKNIANDNVEHAISVWEYARKYEELVKDFLEFWDDLIWQMQRKKRFKEALSIGKQLNDMNAKFTQILRSSIQTTIMNMLRSDAQMKKYSIVLLESTDILMTIHNVIICLSEYGLLKSEAIKICNDTLRTQIQIVEKNPLHLHVISVQLVKKDLDDVVRRYEILINKRIKRGVRNSFILNFKKIFARYYMITGNIERANEIFREIYNIETGLLDLENPECLYTYQNVATCENYDIDICHETLTKFVKMLGSDHPYTFETTLNLGKCLINKGFYNEACNVLYDLVMKETKTFDKFHPRTLLAQYNLATCLQLKGDYEDVTKILKDHLQAYVKLIEFDNVAICAIQSSFANSLINIGMKDEATEIFKNILKEGEDIEEFADIIYNQIINIDKKHYKNIRTNEQLPDEYYQVLSLAKAALDYRTTLQNINMSNVIGSRRDNAYFLKHMGKPDEALNILQETVDEHTRTLGDNHRKTLKAHRDMAYLLKAMGKNDKGIKIIKEIIVKKTNTLGANHQETLYAQMDLALFLKQVGKYNEATDIVVDVIKKQIERKASDSEELNCLKFQQKLADFLISMDQYTKAIEIFREIIKKKTTIQGSNHPSTLETKTDLANLLKRIGEYDLAVDMFEEIIKEKTIDLDHDPIEVLNAQQNLALFFQDIDRHTESLKILQEIITTRAAKFGPYHPETLKSQHNLAYLYSKMGRTDKAVNIFENIIRKQIAYRGKNSLQTLQAQRNLAIFYEKNKEYNKSIKILKKVHKVTGRLLGQGHYDTLDIQESLANCLQKLGKHEDAIEEFKNILQRRVNKLGEDNPETLNTQKRLAHFLWKMGKVDEAEKMFEDIIEKKRNAFGSDYIETLISQKDLADFLTTINKRDKAIEIYKNIVDKLTANLGDDHSITLASMQSLVYLINGFQ